MWTQSHDSKPPTPPPQKSGSAFWGGLTTGVLIGVAGYYLFGTKQGKAVREQIKSEWQKAEAKAKQSPVVETVGEHWQSVFGAIANELGFQRQRHTAKKTRPAARPTAFVKKTKPQKKISDKFSGT